MGRVSAGGLAAAELLPSPSLLVALQSPQLVTHCKSHCQHKSLSHRQQKPASPPHYCMLAHSYASEGTVEPQMSNEHQSPRLDMGASLAMGVG